MLSKLFSNFKSGLSVWLILFAVTLWSLAYYLTCPNCFAAFTRQNWIYLSITFTLLISSLILSSSVFNTRFRVTRNNYYAPLFFAIFISWIVSSIHWYTALQVLLVVLFYFNTYSIFNGSETNQIGYHLNAGFITLLLTLLSPIGIGFLLLSFWQAALDSHSNWRKFVLPFYSFGVGFSIFLGIAFLLNRQDAFLSKFMVWNFFSLDFTHLYSQGIILCFVALYFLLSQSEYLMALQRAPVLKRKILSVINIQFIITIVLFLLFGSQPEYLILPLFALSIVFGNYFQYIKKAMLQELLIWISIFAGIVTAALNLL